MTKKEIIVLKAIKEKYKPGMLVNTHEIRETTSLDPGDFDSVCKKLADENYFTDFGENISYNDYVFFTSYKSDSFDEELRNSRIKFVISTIIVPLIVGALGAVIASLIRCAISNI